MIRAKPLFIAVSLALGASAPAFAQSDSGGNTNAKASPPAVAPAQVNSSMSGATAIAPPISSEEEHGGLRNRMSDDRAVRSDDAKERAARATSKEEEHGGVRNRAKAKKERARERLGLGKDD